MSDASRALADVLHDPMSSPQGVLPEQYLGRSARAAETPERRLMFAVLLDALVQLQRPDSMGAAEVRRWIRSEADWPCSFPNVCAALGLEPSYVARGLRAWHQPRKVHLRQLRPSAGRLRGPLGSRRRALARTHASAPAAVAVALAE